MAANVCQGGRVTSVPMRVWPAATHVDCSTTDNTTHNSLQIFSQLLEDKLVVLEELEVFLIALEVANPKASPMKNYRR